MNRAPLVTLPSALTAPDRARRGRARARATSSASTAAPPRRSPPCSTCTRAPCTSVTPVPPTKTPSAPAWRSRRSSTPPTRRSPAPPSPTRSSRRPSSPSPAPTPPRSTATSTKPAPTTGSSSTTSSAPGPPPPALSPASARSPAPAPTSSASGGHTARRAGSVAPGAPAGGDTCSGTRARATGSASSRSSPRCTTATAQGRRPRSATPPSPSFAPPRSRRSPRASTPPRSPRAKSRPSPSRPRASHTAGDVVARELFARAAALLGEQIRAVIANTGLTGEFPIGLIGSAFRAGEVFVEPLTHAIHEVAPRARVFPVELAPVGGSLLLGMRACGCEGALSGEELSRLLDAAAAADGPASGAVAHA